MDQDFLNRFLVAIASLRGVLRFGALLFVAVCIALISFLGKGDITQKILPFVLIIAIYPMTLIVSILPDLGLSPVQKFVIALVALVFSLGFIALSFVIALAGNSPTKAQMTAQFSKEWQEKYESDMDEFRAVASSLAKPGRKLSSEEYSTGFLTSIDKLPANQAVRQELRIGRLVDFFDRYLACVTKYQCEAATAIASYLTEFWYVCEPLVLRMRKEKYGAKYAESIEVAARQPTR